MLPVFPCNVRMTLHHSYIISYVFPTSILFLMQCTYDITSFLHHLLRISNIYLIPHAPSVPMQCTTDIRHYIILTSSLSYFQHLSYSSPCNMLLLCTYDRPSLLYTLHCVYTISTAIPEDMIQDPEPTEDDPDERIPRENLFLSYHMYTLYTQAT